MKPATSRVVLDTNILVRGLINEYSPSGLILKACEQREFIPVVSSSLLAEYRAILGNPEITTRYPQLERRRVKAVLERLTYLGEWVRPVRVRFAFPRDPKDAKLIELCIAAGADFLITTDPDLLDLPSAHDETSTRFRQRAGATEIIRPDLFVQRFTL